MTHETLFTLCRAAVLERMPVIEKNSPGHTNGESTGEAVKEIQTAKLKQAEALLPPQPANQVSNTCASSELWELVRLLLFESFFYLLYIL